VCVCERERERESACDSAWQQRWTNSSFQLFLILDLKNSHILKHRSRHRRQRQTTSQSSRKKWSSNRESFEFFLLRSNWWQKSYEFYISLGGTKVHEWQFNSWQIDAIVCDSTEAIYSLIFLHSSVFYQFFYLHKQVHILTQPWVSNTWSSIPFSNLGVSEVMHV